jgi:hypothetical protein
LFDVAVVEYLQAVMGSGTEYFGLEGSLQANTRYERRNSPSPPFITLRISVTDLETDPDS